MPLARRPCAADRSLEGPGRGAKVTGFMDRVSHGVVEIATGRLRFSGNLKTAMSLDSWFPA